MGDNFQKKFIKLCQVVNPSDIDHSSEQRFIEQINPVILALSADLTELPPAEIQNDVETSKLPTKLNKIPSLKKINYHTKIARFPRLKLVNDFVDKLYQPVTELPVLAKLLKHLINRAKISTLYSLLNKPEILSKSHVDAVELINQLLNFVVIWKDENQIGFPTYTKLSEIINFDLVERNIFDHKLASSSANTSNKDLSGYSELSQVTSSVTSLIKVRTNQQKRSLIFEKRLRETEQSQIKQAIANEVVDKFLSDVFSSFEIVDFIRIFLDNVWRKILILEFLRDDNEAFSNSIEIAVVLIQSANEKQDKNSIVSLIDSLPNLNKMLLVGFDKLATSEEDKSEFISQLESLHIQIIEKANQVEAAAETFPDQESSPDQKPAQDEEKILRLQPSSLFNDSFDKDNVESACDSSVSNNQAVVNKKVPTVEISFIERVIKKIHTNSDTASDKDSDSNINCITIESTVNNYIAPFPSNSRNVFDELESSYSVRVEQWFYFKTDNSINKLILISEQRMLFVFMDKNIKISFRIMANELIDDLKNNLIIPLKVQLNLDEILLNTINSMQIYLEERKQLIEKGKLKKLEKQKEIKIKLEQEEQNRKNREAEKTAEREAELQRIENNLIERERQKEKDKEQKRNDAHNSPLPSAINNSIDIDNYNIANLPIGSWVNIEISDKPNVSNSTKKCKLAAKIVSKDSYIFVDRKGVKLLELKTNELIDYYQSKKLKLINIESTNDGILASVIAKTRNLKSDH